MNGYLEEVVYPSCPVWLQNLGIGLYGLAWKNRRFGSTFRRELPHFVERERFTAGEWHAYQTQQLRTMLLWCFDETEYYRRTWTAIGLRRGDLDRFELSDLSKLPFVEKEDLRAEPDAFIARGRGPKLHTYATSGSTGTPLQIRMSSITHQRWSAAYEARCRRWAGLHNGMSRAMIGGRRVVIDAVTRPPYWRYNFAERQLYMSAFHIGPATVPDYVRALNDFRPDYLVGYASAHFFLARLIAESGLVVHSPKAILTSSEKLTGDMRALIAGVYRTQVFDAYSGVEPCCLASECEHHRLHISPDVGIVEVITEGRAAAPDQIGEVVATGLFNFDQPLIRYRIGDLAALSNEPCACGRAMPVLRELVGRIEDTVIGPDGREMVRFHGIFIGLPGLVEGQIVQEALDRYTVRVVAPAGFTAGMEEVVRTRMTDRLGPVDVAIEIVPMLDRTASGKLRAVISKVARPGGNVKPGMSAIRQAR